jgi:ATP-dependent DNA helicase RecQ
VRAEVARAAGMPAYVIAHDRTLASMARERPRTLDEMARVHGMGPARIDAYGARFLAALAGG